MSYSLAGLFSMNRNGSTELAHTLSKSSIVFSSVPLRLKAICVVKYGQNKDVIM